jgi:hypothetical protein
MAKGKPRIPQDLQRWIDARRTFHLSHAHVRMARELGMNPRKLGGLTNHTQEPWKAPLPLFIEQLYEKRFGRSRPERVLSIEERALEIAVKQAAKRERRRAARMQDGDASGVAQPPATPGSRRRKQLLDRALERFEAVLTPGT